MLFSGYKVAYERKREIMRNVASVAGLKKSCVLINPCHYRYSQDLHRGLASDLATMIKTSFISRQIIVPSEEFLANNLWL
jgi:hypothetical protein